MKTWTMLAALFVMLVVFACDGWAQALVQEQDTDVRGAFLTTRPKASQKSGMGAATSKPNRRRPKSTPKPPDKVEKPSVADEKTGDGGSAKIRTPKIGLGLTLFARDSNGLAVRVDPTRTFHTGDRVRALLETNADGYLYIFNTTDGGKPVMIYPNPELDEGGNYIQSHVPFEIPASVADQERLRWLTFDKNPGTERLFFVFTREPLPAVPTEDELISFCRNNEKNCPIQPAADLWAKIQTEMSGPVQIAKAASYGKSQTDGEREASTRGLGLSKDDPEPSLVMMASSTNTSMLVAMLELVHK
jgi:Domain of unknown function (DUF4384)